MRNAAFEEFGENDESLLHTRMGGKVACTVVLERVHRSYEDVLL